MNSIDLKRIVECCKSIERVENNRKGLMEKFGYLSPDDLEKRRQNFVQNKLNIIQRIVKDFLE